MTAQAISIALSWFHDDQKAPDEKVATRQLIPMFLTRKGLCSPGIAFPYQLFIETFLGITGDKFKIQSICGKRPGSRRAIKMFGVWENDVCGLLDSFVPEPDHAQICLFFTDQHEFHGVGHITAVLVTSTGYFCVDTRQKHVKNQQSFKILLGLIAQQTVPKTKTHKNTLEREILVCVQQKNLSRFDKCQHVMLESQSRFACWMSGFFAIIVGAIVLKDRMRLDEALESFDATPFSMSEHQQKKLLKQTTLKTSHVRGGGR